MVRKRTNLRGIPIMVRKRNKVYCDGCAHLLLTDTLPPQCVATAKFIEGPLRKRIDVHGRVPAEKRNIKNNCGYREIASLRAYQLKRWILWRLNNSDTGRKTTKKINLDDYSVEIEGARSKNYRKSLEGDNYSSQSETSERATEKREDVFLDGGPGYRDRTGTSDYRGGDDEYPESFSGLEWERNIEDDGGDNS